MRTKKIRFYEGCNVDLNTILVRSKERGGNCPFLFYIVQPETYKSYY